MKKSILLINVLLTLIFMHTSASGISDRFLFLPSFIENKGQIKSESGELPLYYVKMGGSEAYFFINKVCFVSKRVSSKTGKDSLPLFDAARIDLHLINSDAEEISPLNKSEEVFNFYQSGFRNGITDVSSYKKIIYKSIYPDIDLVFYFSKSGSLKYDYIVHAGGKPSEIKMKYLGVNTISELKNGISVRNELMKIEDSDPIAFYGGEKAADSPLDKILCSLENNSDEIFFRLAEYDSTKKIIIDPNLEWSFLTGGRDGDHGYALQLDKKNNIFLGGNSLSGDFPVTPGSWQDVKAGHFDAYIAKFNAGGKLQWATFFGGTQAEYIYDMKLDRFENIIIGGWTWSEDMPVNEGAFQEDFIGSDYSTEGFLAKFDNAGKLLWSTYYGGWGNEHINSLDVDNAGLIALTGWTNSRGFVVSANAFQDTLRGAEDAFLARFTQDGEFIWATFFGGDSLDKATSISYDKSGNIVFSGYTQSIRLPVSGNPFQTINMGAADCFIAKFSGFGDLIWSGYFGGKHHDYSEDIVINSKNEILIAGRTYSDSLPFGENSIQKYLNGGEDAFLAKFSSDGSDIMLGTYLGGTGKDAAYAVNVDKNDAILIAGRTESKDFPVSPGAFSENNSGIFDSFAARIKKSGDDFYWSTYAGGSDEEWTEDIISDDSLNVIVTGATASPDFPIIGGISNDEFKGVLDVFLMKFCPTNPNPVITPLGPVEFCRGDEVTLDAGEGYLEYLWSNGSTERMITVTKSGEYFVAVSDSGGCYNTSKPLKVTVRELPKPEFDEEIFICEGDTIYLDAGEGFDKYKWQDGSETQSIQIFKAGDYTCRVSDTFGCSGNKTAKLIVNPRPQPSIEGPKSVCLSSEKIEFKTEGTAGNKYEWFISGGEITRGRTTNVIETKWNKSGTAFIKVVETILSSGCSGTAVFEVKVSGKLLPEIKTLSGDSSFCRGDSLVLDAGAGYESYSWNNGSTERFLNVTKGGAYFVTVWDAQGCSGNDTINIIENMPPDIIINFDSAACAHSIKKITAGFSDDYSYEWTISGGEILENNNNEITVKWGDGRSGRAFLTVTDLKTGCSADTSVQVQLMPNPVPEIKIIGSVEFCEGDSVVLFIERGYSQIIWNGSIVSDTLIVKTAGKFFAEVTGKEGCTGIDSIETILHPLPEKPEITERNDTLFSTPANTYQWLRDGSELSGAGSRFLIPSGGHYFSVKITNEFGCENISDEYYYEEISPFALFVIPDTIWAETSEYFDVPVMITKSQDLDKVKPQKFKIVFNINRTIMAPEGNCQIIETFGDRQRLEHTFDFQEDIVILDRIPFRALWGNAECSPIIFESAVCLDTEIATEVKDGTFCLENICKAGGERLFLESGELSLKIVPSPVKEKADIKYMLRENGLTSIAVYNSLGNEILKIPEKHMNTGEYTYSFVTSAMPAGAYNVVLKTPAASVSKMFMLVK